MIDKFVECSVPISKCNLRCEYCYVIQENRRNIMVPEFAVSPDKIGEAFSAKRWGGQLLVNLCGYGETLLCQELPQIIYEIAKQGHIINVTNNGTMSVAIDKILGYQEDIIKNILFSFSLHYLELKRLGLLEVFAQNVNRVMSSAASCLVQINLCDSYIDCMDEIKEFCSLNFGALPQVALTRNESGDMSIYTEKAIEDYKNAGDTFASPLFEMTYHNFLVKRNEFCYAGEKTYKLDLATGDLRRCYFERPFYNIYKDMSDIPEKCIGRNCKMLYCVNSSHFMSLGVLPEIECPTYIQLRNRPEANWIKENIVSALNGKFECVPYERNLLNRLHSQNVILYGAGVGAREVYEFLLNQGISPSLVMVTSDKNNPQKLGNINVVKFDDYKELIKESCVIIAVKDERVSKEIEHNLNEQGAKAIIFYQEFSSVL